MPPLLKQLSRLGLAVLALQVNDVLMAQGAPLCQGEGRLQHICTLNNAEDLVLVEGSPWVLTGNMGDKSWSGGGFYLVNTRDRSVRVVRPDLSGAKAAAYKDCPGPPEADKLNVHGVSVRSEGNGRHSVYTVNHGGRRSIEVYELDAGSTPRITWKGCAVAPAPLRFNSVSHLPGEAFAATVFANADDPKSYERAAEGQPSGFVLEWSPASGWTTVPGSEFSGNNGLVATADGKWLYVAGYSGQSVHKLSRGRVPYVRQSVKVGFLADNIRWSPDGKLLVAGHAAPLADVLTGCNGTDHVVCPLATGVAMVDPETMKARTLLVEPFSKNFGAGTTAIVVGDELWLGSVRAQRLGTIKLNQLQN
jgi:hypothetical protein